MVVYAVGYRGIGLDAARAEPVRKKSQMLGNDRPLGSKTSAPNPRSRSIKIIIKGGIGDSGRSCCARFLVALLDMIKSRNYILAVGEVMTRSFLLAANHEEKGRRKTSGHND